MSDFASELPIRSQLPGQVAPDDVIVKIGDGTNPTTQLLGVDSNGRVVVKLDDGFGNPINSQTIASTQWLQVVDPASGPAQPGTASSFSVLAGGIYNSTPPVLTTGQQASLQLDSSGRLLVDTSNTDDHNYGVVGANTLRTAAQIGNATGAADFNAGATGAQTLRVSANQGAPNTVANAWPMEITNGTNTASVSAGGELSVTVSTSLPAGSNTIGNVGVTNLPTTVDTNYGVVGANTIRTASQIGNATGAADFGNGATGAQTLRVAANLAVGGANVSGTNPVPVSITSTLVGTSINNYNTAAAIASNATSNHIYTISSGKTFNGKKIWASASGLMKIEVRVSPDGSTYSTLWVGFNSTATPNITIDLDELVFLESGTGSTIEIIRTNLDKKPMDVYSTISGTEV